MKRPGTVNLRSFHIGVDVGQRVDHTAFVVVEQQVVVSGMKCPVDFEYKRERKLWIRMVQRVRLGTAFHEVVDEVERLTHCPELEGTHVTTTLDATGMGAVVSEDLRRHQLKGELFPVVIGGGLEGGYKDGFWPTPRTELLMGVQRAFEMDGMGVARGVKGWPALAEELRGMRKVQSVRGPRFETLGAHDDLVFALALALFGVRMRWLPVDGETVRRWKSY